ncbi:MAG: hypothetical protein Q7R49_00745 [Candidatus Daviesbacteria bacterium]|nr:hypothetical protein [Candidatus Daviesbacteria bacterium]
MHIENKARFIKQAALATVATGIAYWSFYGDLRDPNDQIDQQRTQIAQEIDTLAKNMWDDGLLAQRGLFAVDRRFLNDPRHDKLDQLDLTQQQLIHRAMVEHPLRYKLEIIQLLSRFLATGVAIGALSNSTNLIHRSKPQTAII